MNRPPQMPIPTRSSNTRIYTGSVIRLSQVDGSGLAGTAKNRSMPSKVRPRARSEEHTSELQSRPHLVCRLLLEKKKKNNTTTIINTPLSNHIYSKSSCLYQVF